MNYTGDEHGFWRETLALAIAFFAKDTLKFTYQKTIGALTVRDAKTEGEVMQLEKAWDLKALAAEAKSQGLNLAEDEAKALVILMLDFVDQSVSLTANPMDDLAKVVVGPAKAFLLAQADKINGKVG